MNGRKKKERPVSNASGQTDEGVKCYPLPLVGVAACPGSTPVALSSARSGAGVTSASVG